MDGVNKHSKLMGILTLTACELDKEYFDKAMKVIENETRQHNTILMADDRKTKSVGFLFFIVHNTKVKNVLMFF